MLKLVSSDKDTHIFPILQIFLQLFAIFGLSDDVFRPLGWSNLLQYREHPAPMVGATYSNGWSDLLQ